MNRLIKINYQLLGMRIFMIAIIASNYHIYCQTNSIIFNYDNNGSLIERKLTTIFQAKLIKSGLQKDSVVATTKPVDFNIYPNPTNDIVNITGILPENHTSAVITISTISGQVIKRSNFKNNELTGINVSDLKNGVYLLTVRYSNSEYFTQQIIINN